MNTLLQNDRAKRPDLFHFLGPIPSVELDTWLSEHQLIIPNDLKQFWRLKQAVVSSLKPKPSFRLSGDAI
jgi:hypothetical protein